MKYLAVALLSVVLVGCGGGGGSTTNSGGSTSNITTVPTVSPSGDVAPVGQNLTITSLALVASDVIANTKPQSSPTIVASIFNGIKKTRIILIRVFLFVLLMATFTLAQKFLKKTGYGPFTIIGICSNGL